MPLTSSSRRPKSKNRAPATAMPLSARVPRAACCPCGGDTGGQSRQWHPHAYPSGPGVSCQGPTAPSSTSRTALSSSSAAVRVKMSTGSMGRSGEVMAGAFRRGLFQDIVRASHASRKPGRLFRTGARQLAARAEATRAGKPPLAPAREFLNQNQENLQLPLILSIFAANLHRWIGPSFAFRGGRQAGLDECRQEI